jgi:competence protein ComGA
LSYKKERKAGGDLIDVTKYLNQLIMRALEERATDIHFIQTNQCCLIKFRIHTSLIDVREVSLEDYQKIVLMIKYRSHMNLNQAKGPQSSAFDVNIGEENYRIRVSTIVTNQKESMVLRLSHGHLHEELSELLLDIKQGDFLNDAMRRKNGLILFTGPTGSGKTTLAYALLHQIKKNGLSIISVEDPVEHYEPGLVQLQINETAGVNYDVSVKEILRHDPDIIFIGEIRDTNSAKSAIRAALTGHLVISTMHAVSSLKALYRLLELGVSRFDLEQILILVTNQRLVYSDNQKKVVLEQLRGNELVEALDSIQDYKSFQYETIEDKMKGYPFYQVIK